MTLHYTGVSNFCYIAKVLLIARPKARRGQDPPFRSGGIMTPFRHDEKMSFKKNGALQAGVAFEAADSLAFTASERF